MSTRVRSVRRRRLGGALLILAIVSAVGASPVGAAPCWFPPVIGTIVDPYRQPPCPWCAGNRGLDYRVDGDVTVNAAATGRVVFVGTVVDVQYVVIQLPNGWRHTYGQLMSTPLHEGDVVFANGSVGRAAGTFFFGLRIEDDYADPAPFIGVLRGRPRLVPTDATPARPAPPTRLRCSR